MTYKFNVTITDGATQTEFDKVLDIMCGDEIIENIKTVVEDILTKYIAHVKTVTVRDITIEGE